jgi:hypothetical protein
MSSQRRRI